MRGSRQRIEVSCGPKFFQRPPARCRLDLPFRRPLRPGNCRWRNARSSDRSGSVRDCRQRRKTACASFPLTPPCRPATRRVLLARALQPRPPCGTSGSRDPGSSCRPLTLPGAPDTHLCLLMDCIGEPASPPNLPMAHSITVAPHAERKLARQASPDAPLHRWITEHAAGRARRLVHRGRYVASLTLAPDAARHGGRMAPPQAIRPTFNGTARCRWCGAPPRSWPAFSIFWRCVS